MPDSSRRAFSASGTSSMIGPTPRKTARAFLNRSMDEARVVCAMPPGKPARSRSGSPYSGTVSPEPPNSAGKSFSLGSPSRIGSTVSA